jgi:hypothetical protein
MGVQKQAIIVKQTPDYIPEPEYTVVSLEGDRMIRGVGKVITAPFKAKAHFPKPKRYLYYPPVLIPGKFIPLPVLKQLEQPETQPLRFPLYGNPLLEDNCITKAS